MEPTHTFCAISKLTFWNEIDDICTLLYNDDDDMCVPVHYFIMMMSFFCNEAKIKPVLHQEQVVHKVGKIYCSSQRGQL